MIYLKKYRFDYFLIWGNGLKYRDEIIDILRKKPHLEILKILNHTPKNIKKLVKVIYSYDYAPFQHLKNKTKYLLSTVPEVVFIFVKNNNVREVYAGNGQFRHLECEYIKSIKEEIRDKFNDRKDDRRTEDHVAHASDNESQTDYILKYLDFYEGVNLLKKAPNPLLSVPHHIGKFDKFVLRNVKATQIYCSILTGQNDSFSKRLTLIENTPHYACLCGNEKLYKKYLTKFNTVLQDFYSLSKFTELSNTFSYLNEPYSNRYILTKEFEQGKFQILDGVHRACILKAKGYDNFIIAVVK
jgi:hypothetical protein